MKTNFSKLRIVYRWLKIEVLFNLLRDSSHLLAHPILMIFNFLSFNAIAITLQWTGYINRKLSGGKNLKEINHCGGISYWFRVLHRGSMSDKAKRYFSVNNSNWKDIDALRERVARWTIPQRFKIIGLCKQFVSGAESMCKRFIGKTNGVKQA